MIKINTNFLNCNLDVITTNARGTKSLCSHVNVGFQASHLVKPYVKRIQSNMPRATGLIGGKAKIRISQNKTQTPCGLQGSQTSVFLPQYPLLFNHEAHFHCSASEPAVPSPKTFFSCLFTGLALSYLSGLGLNVTSSNRPFLNSMSELEMLK